jgi:hypothetical protein
LLIETVVTMISYKDVVLLWQSETSWPAVEFLVEQGVIKNSIPCPTCTLPTKLVKVSVKERRDGYAYKCTHKVCKQRKVLSVRNSSEFLLKFCRTSLNDLIHLIYMWSLSESVKNTVAKTSCSKKTVISVFRELRHICDWKLRYERAGAGPTLGGAGKVVEIDESCFRHKPKYHKGRTLDPRWVFGIIDRSSTPAKGYMKLVDKRDADTLLPIIEQQVKPGTFVLSDQWRAYNRIDDIPGLDHGTVNHSVNFVCPETGNHTQGIESYWAQTKYKIKCMKGVRAVDLVGYLEEKQWRDRNGGTSVESFEHILADIGLRYL